MEAHSDILETMLNFYKKRYEGSELEKKFNNACEDLIISGDLNKASYIRFCMLNDIEPKVEPKVEHKPSKSSYYDGCSGPVSRSSRSSC